MKKYWVLLVCFFVTLFFFPKGAADQLKKMAIKGASTNPKGEYSPLHSLELENQVLRGEIQRLMSMAISSKELEAQVRHLLGLEERATDAFFERRERYLAQILSRRLVAVPAKVVFRDPIHWSHSFWVGVGERDNQALGKRVIEPNSPVVVGKTVIGVVEEVEQERTLVRLVTDDRVALSVRAVRGGEQSRLLASKINELVQILSLQEDLQGSKEMQKLLMAYEATLNTQGIDAYLAKGEVRGLGPTLAKGGKEVFKGLGFHYYCPDEEGSAIDLRQRQLLQLGDLLVTTGMDGIFPPDLQVGVVTHVDALREGATSYSLTAKPLISHMEYLEDVWILPRNF